MTAIDYFSEEKQQTLDYLLGDDPRGFLNILGVEANLRGIVSRINFLPFAYTWGESCHGNFWRDSFAGYLSIAVNGLEDSQMLIKALMHLQDKYPILGITEDERSVHRKGKVVYSLKVYHFNIRNPNFTDRSRADDYKLDFRKFWQDFEAVIDQQIDGFIRKKSGEYHKTRV